MIECTGISAGWCPIHGDCKCPIDPETGETMSDDGQELARNSEKCPLHAPWSNHGEQEFAGTIWGSVEIGEVD